MKLKVTIIAGIVVAAVTAVADLFQTGGIGIAITRVREGEPLRVAVVFPSSPADAAGIKTNWFLVSVDGANVVGMASQQCMKAVSGPVGTPVTLELADPTMSRTNKFSIKRADVRLPDDWFRTYRPSGPLLAQ